ncbi:hypothetical protein ONZ43_g7091 [Nemania bipapillata]|uniref:Uncharacterized protein n=1 Tax=Nemania bipapillata TaxID=110536 RepID=A0ACC2HTF8_9PEZI|nr:hypothetical protein ONZ43_g7091 [Nemania bipapillata]
MANNEAASGQRALSGTFRDSKLPRRGASRRKDVAQRADLNPVSRKSSQASVSRPESRGASEQEARLGKDTIKSHRRNSSITGQESDDRSTPESPFRRAATGAVSTPADISFAQSTSQIPRGPGAQGSSPRQPFKRQCSLQAPTDANMADLASNKPISRSPASKRSGGQSSPYQSHSERTWPREESYVQIDEMPTPISDERDSVGVQPAEVQSAPKIDGLVENVRMGLNNDRAEAGVTYSPVLDPSLHSEDSFKDQDDDDSYPELDEMGMEEIHRPPPRSPNGGISSKAPTDGTLKYRSEWLRQSYIWHFFADYYPARLHKTHDLPATRKYIFGYHPHGIISHGAWAAFATDALGFSLKFPNITNSLLTLDSNFRIPFYREYILSMGVRSVSKESIVNILNKGGLNGEGMGRAVTVVIGGARESLEAQPGMMRLILRERKGFIKLAVRCGADLVPVLAFGENDLYDQLQPQEHPFMHRIQMFILKVWKFTLPFLHGRGIFNYDVGLMPYRRPLNIVVGAPIKVRQSASVNQEEINRLHDLYVAELEKLWDRYKYEFAPDRKQEMQILP